MNNKFMVRAIKLSVDSVDKNGGPFASVLVKDNNIISEGMNRVTSNNDPTAHGEIVAIRKACETLNTFNLSGAEIYTSCEPCPMCLSAIYWAHVDKIYYGNTRNDAAKIGFDDNFIYQEFNKNMNSRKIPMIQTMKDEALKAFDSWKKKPDKIKY